MHEYESGPRALSKSEPIPPAAPDAEWLETDGLGGFASGSVDGIRRRRYHGLLISALDPPNDRRALVKGLELWLEGPLGSVPLSAQRYRSGVTHPRGDERVASFSDEPWPTWTFQAAPELTVRQEVCMAHGMPLTLVRVEASGDLGGYSLHARMLCSGRDLHTLEHEDALVAQHPVLEKGVLRFCLRDSRAALLVRSNARYIHSPDWYRAFHYDEERARGLDHEEDLASPGTLVWPLERGPFLLLLGLDTDDTRNALEGDLTLLTKALFARESERRSGFASRLHRAADAYVVARGGGATVIAGYPWFGDWGRDTFIALRGIGLATGRFALVRDVLLAWSEHVSEGMLPNRFADGADAPEYNAVDASLWYVVAFGELLERGASCLSARDEARLVAAVLAIIRGYRTGTRHGIRADDDGLLAAGAPLVQLTWMDARVDGRVITQRSGKPVEVQALWIRALEVAGRFDRTLASLVDRAATSFAQKFWCEERGYLYDVVEVDHVPGKMDDSLRPNQLLALGTLGRVLVPEGRAERALAAIERELLTPLGLRSLAPSEPGYIARYAGGPRERDSAYHQGTVWPWLLGPFVDAWLRARGNAWSARREAYTRFVVPMLEHLRHAGIGHVSEVADAEPPHSPGGCPFQAWSVGELLRLAIELSPSARAPNERNKRDLTRVPQGTHQEP